MSARAALPGSSGREQDLEACEQLGRRCLPSSDQAGPMLEIPRQLGLVPSAGGSQGVLDVIEERGRQAPAWPMVPCVDEEHVEPGYARRGFSASLDFALYGH